MASEASGGKTLEERRAAILIKYRRLNVDRVEAEGDRIRYLLSQGDKKYVMMCIIGVRTVGVSYVRELKELVDKEGGAKGILVVGGKYTYSADSYAEKEGLELIKPSLPAFDLFEQKLVPRHEILTEEEGRRVLKAYHAKPFQLPWIKADDPVSIILGAGPGDIIRISGKSETAGMYESYRLVVR